MLYEKSYSKDVGEDQVLLEAFSDEETSAADRIPSTEEFLGEIEQGFVLNPIPDRQEAAETFVLTARQISEDYKLDIKIVQYPERITANYYFDAGGCMRFFKRIILLADEISFFSNIEGHRIIMSLDYYTHAGIFQGHQLFP